MRLAHDPSMASRTKLGAYIVGVLAACAVSVAFVDDARACGGCFVPPAVSADSPSVVTDHRMILSVSKEQTSLYDEIRYSGNPASFSWVLPIRGLAKIGLSADVVFSTVHAYTATNVIAPPTNCPQPRCPSRGGFGDYEATAAAGPVAMDASAGASGGGTVTVTAQATVGPYETVQLKSTDPRALNDWLSRNGFNVPPDVAPIIDSYVREGFDFLAMKLVPGAGIQAMRPVRVTTQGASLALPLRMVAAGTGPTVGITLWVIGEGGYEPQNFPFFKIDSKDLVWDWATSSSNYKELREQNTKANNGRGWEIESSTYLPAQTCLGAVMMNDINNAPDGKSTYLAADANGTEPAKSPEQVRTEDLEALFHGIPGGTPRVTRLRADLAHAALDKDLVLVASADQNVFSNNRQALQEKGQPTCPVYSNIDCSVIGSAPRDEANRMMSQSSNGKESFSCATSTSPVGSTAALGGLGLAALIGIGLRRRRAREEKP
jgi:MYXO-CTERM domain-containing protein